MRKHFIRYTLLVLLTIPIHQAGAAICGSLLSTQGPVEILHHQSETRRARPAHADDALDCEDVVVTKNAAGATIAISRGKFVVGADSRIEVARYKEGPKDADVKALNLIYGRARFLVAKKTSTADSHFEVRTPSATVGVRGTDFFVSHDVASHVSSEATIESNVDVTNLDTGETVPVGAGMQVADINAGTALKTEPISDSTWTQIKATSDAAPTDPDFAVTIPKSSNPTHTKTTPTLAAKAKAEPETTAAAADGDLDLGDKKHALVLSVGPSAAKLFHSHSQLDSDSRKSTEVALQYQKLAGDFAWIGRLGFSQTKDDGTSGQGVNNQLSMVTAEGGLRYHPDQWWSPYVRAGLGLANDDVVINRSDLGYYSDVAYSSIALVGSTGVDMMILPTPRFGFYGAAEVQAAVMPFTLQTTTHSNAQTGAGPSYASDGASPSLLLALKIAIGVVARF